MCWLEFYFTVELLNDWIKNYETKTDSIFVDALIILDKTELLEKIMSILLLDSKSSVFDDNIQIWFITIWINIKIFFYRNNMFNVSILCILDSIRLKSQHHLEQPRIISNNLFISTLQLELATKLDLLVICFILLHANYVLH